MRARRAGAGDRRGGTPPRRARRSSWPPRSRRGSAAARCSAAAAGRCDNFVGEATQVRRLQGAVPGDPHRAAASDVPVAAPDPSAPRPPATGRRRPVDAPRRARAAVDAAAGSCRSLESALDVHPHRRRRPRRLLRRHAPRWPPGTPSPSSTRTRSRTSASRSASDRTWEEAGGRFTIGHGARDRRADRGRDRARPTSSSPPPTATTRTSSIAQIAQRHFEVDERHRPRDRPGARRLVRASRACRRSARRSIAIEMFELGARRHRLRSGASMYVDHRRRRQGRAGTSPASCIDKGHEVTLIEQRPHALPDRSSRSSSTPCSTATRPSCGCSSAPASSAPTSSIAVTGDDEDNLLICQIAREKYLCERIIARVNNPRNRAVLRAARHPARGLRDRPDPAPDRARGAAATASCTCSTCRDEQLEIIEVEVADGVAGRRPARSQEIALPEGALVISRAARRRRLRAQGRHRHRGRRRGAASCSTRASRTAITAQFAPARDAA